MESCLNKFFVVSLQLVVMSEKKNKKVRGGDETFWNSVCKKNHYTTVTESHGQP